MMHEITLSFIDPNGRLWTWTFDADFFGESDERAVQAVIDRKRIEAEGHR